MNHDMVFSKCQDTGERGELNHLLYYISHNPFKCEEVKALLTQREIAVETALLEIKEIQSSSIEEIARDKAKKAFAKIKRPLLVEQTGLVIEGYNGFPGGLTQLVWDAIGAESFCKLFGGKAAKAMSIFAYCDGKKVFFSYGETKGQISNEPLEKSMFQWDTVFIPEDYTNTFSEMTPEEKNKVSMRRKALDEFEKSWRLSDGHKSN